MSAGYPSHPSRSSPLGPFSYLKGILFLHFNGLEDFGGPRCIILHKHDMCTRLGEGFAVLSQGQTRLSTIKRSDMLPPFSAFTALWPLLRLRQRDNLSAVYNDHV